MKESIKALLGISVVDSLENDLRRILSKNIRLAQEGSDEHKLAELKSEKDAVEENLEKTDEEILELEEPNGDELGDAGTDTGKNPVPERDHRRGKLV